MALTVVYFCDSFDHYATADVLKKWDTSSGAFTVSASNGRRSTSSFRQTSAGGLGIGVPAVSTVSACFGFRAIDAPAGNSILRFQNVSTIHVDLRVLADLSLQATRNGTVLGTSAAGVISVGSYSHIEMKVLISDTVGTVQVWVNEASVLSLTNQDTKNGATTTVTVVEMGMNGNQDCDFDDFIVGDDQIGDKHVKALFPDGEGAHLDFTTSGSATHFQNVNETPPNDDSDYNFSSTLNQIDTYTVENAAAGEVITAVAVHLYAKKTDTGSRSIAPVIRHSAADNVGTNANPSDTSYLYLSQIYMTNPGTGLAWVTADFNAAEFGVKVTV